MIAKGLVRMVTAAILAVGGGWLFSTNFAYERGVLLRAALKDTLISGNLGLGLWQLFSYGMVLCLSSGAIVGALAFCALEGLRPAETARPKGAFWAFTAALAIGAGGPLASSWWRSVAIMSPLEQLPVAGVVALALLAIGVLLLWPQAVAGLVGQLGLAPAVASGLTAGAVTSTGLEPILLEAFSYGQRNRAGWALVGLTAVTVLGVIIPAMLLAASLLKTRAFRFSAARLFGSAALAASAVLVAFRMLPDGANVVACDLGRVDVWLSLGLAGGGLSLAALALTFGSVSARVAGQGLALVAALGLLTAFSHPNAASCTRKGAIKELVWPVNDEPGAIAKGKAEKRPVVLYFGAEWCQPCRMLGETTLVNPAVIDLLKGYSLMRLDFTEDWPAGEELKKKYGVESLPTMVFLSHDGHPAEEKIVGFVEPAELIRVASLVH